MQKSTSANQWKEETMVTLEEIVTIEERAKTCAKKVTDRVYWLIGHKSPYSHIKDALTEQDRIARAEERERCIRLAIKVYADLLSASGYDIGSINSELQRLRKAIEEGGEVCN